MHQIIWSHCPYQPECSGTIWCIKAPPWAEKIQIQPTTAPLMMPCPFLIGCYVLHPLHYYSRYSEVTFIDDRRLFGFIDKLCRHQMQQSTGLRARFMNNVLLCSWWWTWGLASATKHSCVCYVLCIYNQSALLINIISCRRQVEIPKHATSHTIIVSVVTTNNDNELQ